MKCKVLELEGMLYCCLIFRSDGLPSPQNSQLGQGNWAACLRELQQHMSTPAACSAGWWVSLGPCNTSRGLQEMAECRCHSWRLSSFVDLSGSGQHRTVAVFTSSHACFLPFTLFLHIQCLLFYCLGSNTSLLVVVMGLPEFQITKSSYFASIQLWSDLWKK